jgi:hypothetical protein
MNSTKIIATALSLILFTSPALASETSGTITAGSQTTVMVVSGSGGGEGESGQFDTDNLQLQIQVLQVEIEIIQALLQLRAAGHTVPNINF